MGYWDIGSQQNMAQTQEMIIIPELFQVFPNPVNANHSNSCHLKKYCLGPSQPNVFPEDLGREHLQGINKYSLSPCCCYGKKVLDFRDLQSNCKEIPITFEFWGEFLSLVQCNSSAMCSMCLHNRPHLCENPGTHLHVLRLMFPVLLTMISP